MLLHRTRSQEGSLVNHSGEDDEEQVVIILEIIEDGKW